MAVIRDPSATELQTPRPNLSVVPGPAVQQGGAEGRGLVALGESLGVGADLLLNAQKEQQERLNDIKVEDAWNRYKGSALDLTSGEKGVLRLQAGEAVNGDIVGRTQTGLASTRKEILQGLDNDLQRARFGDRADATDLGTQAQVLHHLDTQTRKYADVVMDGSAAAARAQVSAAPESALIFAQAKDAILGQADAYLKTNGITDERSIAAYKAKLVDSLWEQRIDGLVYSNPALAEAMFRTNEKDLTDPKLKLRLQHTTREAALGVTSVNEANRIIDDYRARVAPPSITGGVTPVSSGARSLRNNNPGNIERGPTKWQGEVEGGDSRFVTFATMEDGLLAMQKNLLTYQTKHGLNTVEGIIGRWAPAAENGNAATSNYIATVAAAMGVEPNAPIDLKDPATLRTMMQAMVRVESGGADVDMGSPGQLAPGEVPNPANRVLAANTSGMPNSRDIAAQLPFVMMRVERRATELYGADTQNPDRAAFVKRLTSELQSKIAADVQQLNAIQKQAQGTLIDAVTGVMPVPADTLPGAVQTGAGRGGMPGMRITSFSQIQENPTLFAAWQLLDPQAKLGIERLMENNMRVGDKGDERFYRELWNRIHLEPGDPKKLDFYAQITNPAVADRLSIPQIRELRAELDRSETPGGRAPAQMRRAAEKNVEMWFKTNVMFTAQPERQIAATMRWNEEVGKKVDEYVKAGKDVRPLFTLDAPESVVSPKYLQTFIDSTPAQGVAQGAQAVRAGQQAPLAAQPAAAAPIAQPPSITTRADLDAWFQTLPAGTTTFRGADGRLYKVPPRAPGALPPAAPAPAIEPVTTMNESGKLVTAPQQGDPVPMPRLVAGPAASRRADDNFPTWSDVGAVTGRAARGAADYAVTGAKKAGEAGDAIVAGAVRAAEAVSVPNDAEKAAMAFRDMVRVGRYTRASAPTITQAIESGLLTGPELTTARRMLLQIGQDH